MITLLAFNFELLEDILVPLGICVALPILVVYFVMKARRHEIDRKAEVAMKAIEAGADVYPNFFAASTSKKSRKESLYKTLKSGLVCAGLGLAFILLDAFAWGPGGTGGLCYTVGAILFFIGAALTIAYFIGRKQFAAEIKAEEDSIGKAE